MEDVSTSEVGFRCCGSSSISWSLSLSKNVSMVGGYKRYRRLPGAEFDLTQVFEFLSFWSFNFQSLKVFR